MSKRRIALVSFSIGLALTALSALVPVPTGTGPVCIVSRGNEPTELQLKQYPQKQLGLPLPYYVLHEPTPDCADVTDRPIVEPGLRPVRLVADITLFSVLAAVVLYGWSRLSHQPLNRSKNSRTKV